MVDDEILDEDGLDGNGTLIGDTDEEVASLPDGESFCETFDADEQQAEEDDNDPIDESADPSEVADADGNMIVIEDYEDDDGDEQLTTVPGDEEDDLGTEFDYTDDDGVPLDSDGNELAVDDVDDYTARAADDPMNFDAVADEDVEDMDA